MRSCSALVTHCKFICDDSGATLMRRCRTAYRAGVTLAISSLAKPIYLAGSDAHIISGLSTSFRTGSLHAMQRGAIVQDVAALHVVMGKSFPAGRGVSVSTQLAGLRRLLYGWESDDKETGFWFRKAAEVRYISKPQENAANRLNNRESFHL